MYTTHEISQLLSNQHRTNILHWLRDPVANFSEYIEDKDMLDKLKNDFGVCAGLIHRKSGLAQPTVSNYLKQLTKAGLLETKRYGTWVHYRRNEKAIEQYKKDIAQI